MFGMLFLLVVLGGVAAGAYAYSTASDAGKKAAVEALQTTLEFYRAVAHFLQGGSYSQCKALSHSKRAKIHVFGLCMNFRLWNRPHYRHSTFQKDLAQNLRNVAVPGTGVPLSVFAFSRLSAGFALMVLYPAGCLVAAVRECGKDMVNVRKAYEEQLLRPDDWFYLWRLNCVLASWHALVTNEEGYKLEDKLTFLQVAEEKDVAVTPFMDIPAIICKHRNEEGGLGYKFFSNAMAGGDWIIQEVLSNDSPIKELLPDDAPLSTFRVITLSEHETNEITALSCVWRAGMAGAKTDHKAIFFDVDVPGGVFKKGASNANWYQLGVTKAFKSRGTTAHEISMHPDNQKTIAGEKIDAEAIVSFATRAHKSMMPRVPLVGWDVALTEKGMVMLECNLSCNFFLGSFDMEKYFDAVGTYFEALETLEASEKAT
ncbi:Hypothetical Protein FCC1311_106682 [Hondaea fermentalgiana]|uniref:Alpha-L-glutamate ligase-related protein ATP-grasp domain-containing protein n=1 Tax=Hondaea fermentalgiana TaxID=2315210 RepID=A0A2R5H242_9STRA|nr:Hypothetical Protein FCC1311_106682 [Hondaea fermentalgiana]|eukprot:GBG34444.1 Hypothetical Protein FCC1311_106682 [Hondaea fermentalgiana]